MSSKPTMNCDGAFPEWDLEARTVEEVFFASCVLVSLKTFKFERLRSFWFK